MAAMIKLGYEAGVDAAELAFYRFAFGLPPLLALDRLDPQFRRLADRSGRSPISARGVLGLTTMMLAFSALAFLPLAEATTIGFVAPLFSVMLSALILGERSGGIAGARSRSASSACSS